MNAFKKKKLKKLIKEKWIWFLSTGLFLVGGTIALLIGFQMTGWSIVKWLHSPYATTCFILLVIGLLLLLVLVIEYKRNHLGGYDK